MSYKIRAAAQAVNVTFVMIPLITEAPLETSEKLRLHGEPPGWAASGALL